MIQLSQSHFLANGSSGDGQWIVPLTLCCNSYKNQKKILLETKSGKLDIREIVGSSNGNTKDKEGYSWIKFNVNQTSFYRVKYDDPLTAALTKAIKEYQLSATDRYGLIEDSFALCMASKQTLSSLFMLLDAYRKELEYSVLSHIITSWEPRDGESHLDATLRGELLTALAKLGHVKTQKEAAMRFNAFLNDRNTSLLPPDTRKAAYVAVMQGVTISNRQGYDSLLKIYRETDQSEEKVRVLGSLASCPDPDVVLEALNFLLTPEVRNQDAVYGVRVSWEGRGIAWTWLKENWEYASKTWDSISLLTRIISSIVSPFCTEEKAKEVEEFFASRTKPSIARTLKQSLENVRNNAIWLQSIKNDHSLEQVLKELLAKTH